MSTPPVLSRARPPIVLRLLVPPRPVVVVLALAAVVVLSATTRANELAKDEPIRKLAVTLSVGAAGGDLKEPVALDLGLGFPLWLATKTDDPRPPLTFGAVAQDTDARDVIPRGGMATFSFDAEALAPGLDVLLTTRQLLKGVTVGNIGRVGLLSLPRGNWTLAGYEVRINGKVLLAAKDVNLDIARVARQAEERLAELNQKVGAKNRERQELRRLVDGELADAADVKRLQEVEEFLAAAGPERARLERQLLGQFPWHWQLVGDGDRAGSRTAQLTVVTDTHSQADTSNYVYFQAGAKKYLIGGPEFPMMGTQRFQLDLAGAPLLPHDRRNYGLGMLAAPLAWTNGPDRWHPRRVKLELDGELVYDSDDVACDRASLAAVRLTPPQFYNDRGRPADYRLGPRDAAVWEVGKGQGLQAGTERPADLSGRVTTETGQELEVGHGDTIGDGPAKEDVIKIGDRTITLPAANYAKAEPGTLFPGETPPFADAPPVGQEQPPALTVGGLAPQQWGGAGGFGGGVIPPFQGSPDLGQNDVPLPDLLDQLPPVPSTPAGPAPGPIAPSTPVPAPAPVPTPAGAPIQVSKVEANLQRLSQNQVLAMVQWEVTGDESTVDHFNVFLDKLNVSEAGSAPAIPKKLGSAPRGTRTFAAPAAVDSRTFQAPRIVAVPKDPAVTPHENRGAAIFFSGRTPFGSLSVVPSPTATADWQSKALPFSTDDGLVIGRHMGSHTFPGSFVVNNFDPTPKAGGEFRVRFSTTEKTKPTTHFYVGFADGPADNSKIKLTVWGFRKRFRADKPGDYMTDAFAQFLATRKGKDVVQEPAAFTAFHTYLIDGSQAPLRVEMRTGLLPGEQGSFTPEVEWNFLITYEVLQGQKDRPPVLFGLDF